MASYTVGELKEAISLLSDDTQVIVLEGNHRHLVIDEVDVDPDHMDDVVLIRTHKVSLSRCKTDGQE